MNQEEFFKRYTYSPSRDRIGGGGFGTVYKAYDEVLHREVAIKVSEVKTTADGKKTFSLKDEFEALNHVPKHPNIANYEEFYSFEMPNGIFDYAVMQYYPDGNLSNAIKQSLTEDQKEDVATQLLEGIDFLHKHKVVHRDLKPGNILIVKHGGRIIPLITDFGLSKAAGVVDGSVFSNSFGAGTPRYSSPEQLQGNPLRLNTDLWSYGAILYELFTGEQLFSAGSGAANTAQADMEIYNKIVNGNVQSLGKMPGKWRKVAERCLVVDSTKRAKDATELFAIIKSNAPDDDETEITEGPGIHDLPSSAPKDVPVSSQGNKKGLWIGLGIAVATLVVLLLLFIPKHDSEPHILLLDEQFVLDSTRVADSIAKVQEALAQAEAQKKEDEAYARCTTIKACDAYLKTYPQGRYVEQVKAKRDELEQKQTKLRRLTDSNFDDFISSSYKIPVIIDFYASWCKPCRELEPIIEELIEVYSGRIIFGRYDVDQGKTKVQQFIGTKGGGYNVPTLLFVKNGKILDKKVGFLKEDGKMDIVSKIEQCFFKANESKENQEQRKAELKAQGYVDLGLPSGTWWKSQSETDGMTYQEAIKTYGNRLPSKEQWKELINNCRWVWYDEGDYYEQDGERYKLSGDSWYKIIGKNGNSIALKANGYSDLVEMLCVGCGGIGGVGGYYLSSDSSTKSIWYLGFDSEGYGFYEWKNYFNGKYQLDIQLVQTF